MFSFRCFRCPTSFITFVIAFAVSTDQFLYAAIVPVATFALQDEVPQSQVQYWVAVLTRLFGIGCCITSIPWRWYTDRSSSRRIPCLLALMMLLVATVLLWVAPRLTGASTPVQAISRPLQGFASTVVWTTGLAVLVDTVGYEHMGEYSGYIGIALNAGSITAPLLGGIVLANSGHDAVFALVLAVAEVEILFRLIMRGNACDENTEVPFDMGTDLEAEEKKSVFVETSLIDPAHSSQEDLAEPAKLDH